MKSRVVRIPYHVQNSHLCLTLQIWMNGDRKWVIVSVNERQARDFPGALPKELQQAQRWNFRLCVLRIPQEDWSSLLGIPVSF